MELNGSLASPVLERQARDPRVQPRVAEVTKPDQFLPVSMARELDRTELVVGGEERISTTLLPLKLRR